MNSPSCRRGRDCSHPGSGPRKPWPGRSSLRSCCPVIMAAFVVMFALTHGPYCLSAFNDSFNDSSLFMTVACAAASPPPPTATPDPLNQPIASGGSVRCVNERFGPVGETLNVQFYPSAALGLAGIASVAARGQLYMENCSVFTGADVASPSTMTQVYLVHHEPSVPSMAVRNTTADGINDELINVTISRSAIANALLYLWGPATVAMGTHTNTSAHRNRRLLLVIEHSVLYDVGIQVRYVVMPNEYPSLYYYGTPCQSTSFSSSSSATHCANRRMLDEDYAAFTIILRNNTIRGAQSISDGSGGATFYLLFFGPWAVKDGGVSIYLESNDIRMEPSGPSTGSAGLALVAIPVAPQLRRLILVVASNAIVLSCSGSTCRHAAVVGMTGAASVAGPSPPPQQLLDAFVMLDHNRLDLYTDTSSSPASVVTAYTGLFASATADDPSAAPTSVPYTSVPVVRGRPRLAFFVRRSRPSALWLTSNNITARHGLMGLSGGFSAVRYTIGPQTTLLLARNALAPSTFAFATTTSNVINLNANGLVLSANTSTLWIERNVVRGYVNFLVNSIRNDGRGVVGLCQNYFRDAWRAGPDVEQLGTVAIANITGCENATRTATTTRSVSKTPTVFVPVPTPPPTVNPGPVGATATTATVGVIGTAASPLSPDSVASIQLLAMFAVMACGVPGSGDGGAMRSFLAPIQVGGRSGYLVGNLILIVVVLAAYGAVFGALFAWTRCAARTQQLLRHPRLMPLLHTLALPGLAFESAQLLYGNERPTAGEQALGALVLIASLASVAVYPAISAYFHHRVAAIESTTVACRLDSEALAALVPRVVRVALVPPMAWAPEVLASARCVYAALRARPALQHHAMSAHALGRVVLVALVCAIRPADPAHCAGVLGVAAAICFAHALLLVATGAYRIPGVTACQAAQSVAVGCVATVRAANGSPEAGTSFAMILAIASLANVAVIVAAFVLEFKLRLFPVWRAAVVPQDAAEMGEVDVPKESPRAAAMVLPVGGMGAATAKVAPSAESALRYLLPAKKDEKAAPPPGATTGGAVNSPSSPPQRGRSSSPQGKTTATSGDRPAWRF